MCVCVCVCNIRTYMRVYLYIFILPMRAYAHLTCSVSSAALKLNSLKSLTPPCTPTMDVFDRVSFKRRSTSLGSRNQTSSSARWVRSVGRSEDVSTRPVGVVASRCQRRAWTLRLRRFRSSRRRSLNRKEWIVWPTCPCPRWHRIRIIVRPNTDRPVHRGRRIHLALYSIKIIARRDLIGRDVRYWFSFKLLKFAHLFSSTSQSVWRTGFNTISKRLPLTNNTFLISSLDAIENDSI